MEVLYRIRLKGVVLIGPRMDCLCGHQKCLYIYILSHFLLYDKHGPSLATLVNFICIRIKLVSTILGTSWTTPDKTCYLSSFNLTILSYTPFKFWIIKSSY